MKDFRSAAVWKKSHELVLGVYNCLPFSSRS